MTVLPLKKYVMATWLVMMFVVLSGGGGGRLRSG
jgi:hypothetical protein